MNQQQKTYFIKRVDEIKDSKLSELVRKVKMTVNWEKEKAKAFSKKLVELKTRSEIKGIINKSLTSGYPLYGSYSNGDNFGTLNIKDLLDGWSEWKSDMDEKEVKMTAEYESLRREITHGASGAKDVIMFGDESEALKMLSEFENTNYLK